MAYPDYAMSQGGDDDDGADFGYLEFEPGTQHSQYDYNDFSSHQESQHLGGQVDDLNFLDLSLHNPDSMGEPHSQSDMDPYNQQQHQQHKHSSGNITGGGDQRGFEDADEQDLNDQPLALTELPAHACKYVAFVSSLASTASCPPSAFMQRRLSNF